MRTVPGVSVVIPARNEALRRNEDYALNWRLREQGRTVWLDPRLEVAYRPRGSLGALARQYFANGWWKRIMLGRHPRSLRWRQCAAPALALGLAGSAVLAAAGLRRRMAAPGARDHAPGMGGRLLVRHGEPVPGNARRAHTHVRPQALSAGRVR